MQKGHLIRCSLFHWHITTVATGVFFDIDLAKHSFSFLWGELRDALRSLIEITFIWNIRYNHKGAESELFTWLLPCRFLESMNVSVMVSPSKCSKSWDPLGTSWEWNILELLDALDAISLTLPYLAGQGKGCQKHESWHGLRAGRAQGRGPCRRKVWERDAMSNRKFIADG